VVVSVVVDEVMGAGAGVSTTTGAGAGVSITTGAGGGGTSTTTAAGGGGTGVVSTITGAGVCTRAGLSVTVTVDFAFSGIMLTFVFKPVAEALPEPPAELLVYARPVLSTAAGPEMTAGVPGLFAAFCVFAGAGAVASADWFRSWVRGRDFGPRPQPTLAAISAGSRSKRKSPPGNGAFAVHRSERGKKRESRFSTSSASRR